MNFLKMWNWRAIVKNTLIYIVGMTLMILFIIIGSALPLLDELPTQKKMRIHKNFNQ